MTGKVTENGARAPLGIVLAVDVRLYREGLASSLGAYPHLRIDAATGNLADARDAILAGSPAVIVVDVSLDGVQEFIRELRAGGQSSRIVALAIRDDVAAILDLAQAGADGFVSANASIAELVEAIERAAAGELLCSPRLAAQLLQRAASGSSSSPQPSAMPLTLREQQVLALLRRGLSNKEIGAALYIAEATVKNHVHHILEKLQVKTRSKAAASRSPEMTLLRPLVASKRQPLRMNGAAESFDPDRSTHNRPTT